MRSSLVVALVLATACGGEVAPGIDAPGQVIDASGEGVDAAATDGGPADGAVDAPIDAAIDAPIDAMGMGGCAGSLVGGHCWYKGTQSQSCNGTCASHGGASAATVSYAGAVTAGSRANQAHCQAIAAALSTFAFGAAVTSVGGSNDYGCAEMPGTSLTVLISQNVTTTNGSSPVLRRFCACNQ